MVLLQFKIYNTDISAALVNKWGAAGSAFSGVVLNKQTNLSSTNNKLARFAGITWVDSMGDSKQPENHYIINLFSSKFLYKYGNPIFSFSNKQDHVNPSTSGHYEFYLNLSSGFIDLNLYLEMFNNNGIVDKTKSWSDSNFLYCILNFEICD